VVLRPFSRIEVHEMIDGYLADTGFEFSKQEKELVVGLGGGYPFFTQMAGNYLVEAKSKGLSQDELLHDVLVSFDAQADSHFAYMWSHSSESEKITLLAVISLSKQKASQKTIPNLTNLAKIHSRAHLDVPELVKRGLILVRDAPKAFRLLSPSLERWILREISASPDEEESAASVEAWLAEGGQIEMEAISGILPKFKKKYWPVMGSAAKDISVGLLSAIKEISMDVISNITWEFISKGGI
jgi:hypothetical protein